MAALIEAIAIKRKMFFEFEGAPYHCLDVEVSRPTARGGQTLVRIKMRNLLTRAVFDKTFKAGEKFGEPDLAKVEATYQYADGNGYHFMDQETFDGLTLQPEMLGALGLIELQAGPRCRLVVQAFDRCGAPAAAYPFYEVHAEVDPRHGKDWLEKAIVPTVERWPHWGPRIVRGALWRSTVNAAFLADVTESLVGDARSGEAPDRETVAA